MDEQTDKTKTKDQVVPQNPLAGGSDADGEAQTLAAAGTRGSGPVNQGNGGNKVVAPKDEGTANV